MFGAEVIDAADQQDEAYRRHPDVLPREPKVAHGIPAAHGSGDNEICQQEQGSEHCEDTALLPSRGINTTPIGEMLADDYVIVADQPRQEANGQNDRKGSETGSQKRKPNDIRLARAPVAVEQSRRACPADIAGSMHSDFHRAESI